MSAAAPTARTPLLPIGASSRSSKLRYFDDTPPQTLYRHVSPLGELRPDGVKLLQRGGR